MPPHPDQRQKPKATAQNSPWIPGFLSDAENEKAAQELLRQSEALQAIPESSTDTRLSKILRPDYNQYVPIIDLLDEVEALYENPAALVEKYGPMMQATLDMQTSNRDKVDAYVHLCDKDALLKYMASANKAVFEREFQGGSPLDSVVMPNEMTELMTVIVGRGLRAIEEREAYLESQSGDPFIAQRNQTELAALAQKREIIEAAWKKSHETAQEYFGDLQRQIDNDKTYCADLRQNNPFLYSEEQWEQLDALIAQKEQDLQKIRERLDGVVEGRIPFEALEKKEELIDEKPSIANAPSGMPEPPANPMVAAQAAAGAVDCSWNKIAQKDCEVATQAPPPPVPDLSATAADIHARR
jgi:hypothetical protein